MDRKTNDFSRHKFIGNADALSVMGALGMGAVISSCRRKPKYTAPVSPDMAPDGPVLKAGLTGCRSRGTGAAINFLDAGPNFEITALGDIFEHRIVDYQGNLIWKYEYPVGEDGQPMNRVAISPYVQEHINLVTAIRTDGYINETQNVCESNMIGIMGRESAYTGHEVTRDQMMNSNMKLGPAEYTMGPVDPGIVPRSHPVPGTAPA